MVPLIREEDAGTHTAHRHAPFNVSMRVGLVNHELPRPCHSIVGGGGPRKKREIDAKVGSTSGTLFTYCW